MKKPFQYTVRNIPERMRLMVRERAQKEGKSINTVLLECLSQGIGYADQPVKRTDLDFLIGSWQEDPEFEKAMEDFSQVDKADWS